jgi:hypothetical protein
MVSFFCKLDETWGFNPHIGSAVRSLFGLGIWLWFSFPRMGLPAEQGLASSLALCEGSPTCSHNRRKHSILVMVWPTYSQFQMMQCADAANRHGEYKGEAMLRRSLRQG